MSAEQQSEENPLEGKYVRITDPKLIEELNKTELWVAPNETDDTYDLKIVGGQSHDYNKSADSVGQLRPIEVAVWKEDPNGKSDNSPERIHMRIINGRHRYRQNPEWRREYYDFGVYEKQNVDPVMEYYLARGHFDMQKKASREERRVLVIDMATRLMKKGKPAPECCSEIIKIMEKQGISNENSIREVCPRDFKDQERAERKEGKTFEKAGRDTKELVKLKKVAGEKYKDMEDKKILLETENTKMQRENIDILADLRKQHDVMDEMQSKLRVLGEMGQKIKCKCGNEIPVKVDVTASKIIAEKQ
jgi:hypothetical protein